MSQTEATTPPLAQSLFVPLAQWLLVVAIVLAVVAGGMSFLSRSVEVASPFIEPIPEAPAAAGEGGYPAPDFRLVSLQGDLLGPPDFAGEVVLVEFWATWCVPCRLQAQHLEDVYGEMAGKGVQFLAVNVGEDQETVLEYVSKDPFPYPVLLDTEDTLSMPYQIYGLPTVMIVNRAGEITYLETGVSKPGVLRQALAAAGAGAAA